MELQTAINSFAIAAIVFASALGGAILGMWLRPRVPPAHLQKESTDVIKLGSGLVGTMAALVVGLLVASATGTFDTQRARLDELATDAMLLDRVLTHYGPESQATRTSLREAIRALADHLHATTPADKPDLDDPRLASYAEAFFQNLRGLEPRTDFQRTAQQRSLELAGEMGKIRWGLSQASEGSISRPFLVVLAFWLAVIFASFGLLSPRNATVIVVFLVCALSLAGAIFLIVDMDQPFDGLIRVSTAPLDSALAHLGR